MTKITLLKNFRGKKRGTELNLRAHEARALTLLKIGAPSANMPATQPEPPPIEKPVPVKRGTYQRRDMVAAAPDASAPMADVAKPDQE